MSVLPVSSSFRVLYQVCVCSEDALWRCSVSSFSLLPFLLHQKRATPSTGPPDSWPTARLRFTFTANMSCSSTSPDCGTPVSPAEKKVVNKQHLNTAHCLMNKVHDGHLRGLGTFLKGTRLTVSLCFQSLC